MVRLPADHSGPGVPHGTRTGRPGTRPLTANFRGAREGGTKRLRLHLSHVHQLNKQQQGLAALWSGGEVEGLATAAAAPSRGCQIIIIITHTHHACEPHFSDNPPPRNKNGLAACHARQ